MNELPHVYKQNLKTRKRGLFWMPALFFYENNFS